MRKPKIIIPESYSQYRFSRTTIPLNNVLNREQLKIFMRSQLEIDELNWNVFQTKKTIETEISPIIIFLSKILGVTNRHIKSFIQKVFKFFSK